MERVSALALCLLLSLCSATSPPNSPVLTPLNCNETNHADLAADLINERRDEGFVLWPSRIRSIYEQKLEKPAGSSLYYIKFEAKETDCSVLSGKKWKDCNKDLPFHEQVTGECLCITYISRPWRILEVLDYNCTLGTAAARDIVMKCPDCPVTVKDITPDIKAKAAAMVEKFNKESNETHYFKLDEIERVRTQWMFGRSLYISLTIKETDCEKTQANVNLDNCKSLPDSKAHVGFCTGSSYFQQDKQEVITASCEIYNPRPDHHHHHHEHGTCKQEKEGAQAGETAGQGGAGEAGQGEAAEGAAGQGQVEGQGKDVPEKCELGKGKHCGHHKGHKHHCHPGHHHHHHSGHHHHHHPGHHHHDHHHHDHPHHDHKNHTHSHDTAGHGSSSEEITDKKPFKRSKGSVQVYYLGDDTPKTPVPTITRRTGQGKNTQEIADFPNEPSPLKTCPSPPDSESS